MAANGSSVAQAVGRVVAAYQQTTSPTASRQQKAEALQWLETFQKSVKGLTTSLLATELIPLIG
jgi:hypothetical protein